MTDFGKAQRVRSLPLISEFVKRIPKEATPLVCRRRRNRNFKIAKQSNYNALFLKEAVI